MSKYYKAEAVIRAIDDAFDSIPMEQTTEMLKARKTIRSLPTIEVMEYPQIEGITPTLITTEVSEDMDYCNNCPYISHNDDCISREYLEEQYWQTLIPKEMINTDVELGINIGIQKMYEVIKNAPSVVPSRAEGEWFIREYEYFTCNQCGEDVESHAESTQEAINMLENGEYPNYCPNCGARMKEVCDE